MDASTSSQHVSGLLMAAPLTRHGLTLDAPALVSRPYVDMTLALMRRFGARADESAGRLTIRPGRYRPTDLTIEPDASTASYFFAAAAVTGGGVTVPGLGRAASRAICASWTSSPRRAPG
ncbi:3-phosphoshikimate 1-carboxyvinyltransferase OS=Streptomyces glaucescens OX=1907 GN=aroA PE=3 SV=1 [Streptomyces glaucescens]